MTLLTVDGIICFFLVKTVSHSIFRSVWFCDESQVLRGCVWVCVQHAHARNVWGECDDRGLAALLVLNVRWSRWMSTTLQCVEVKREGILSSDYSTASFSLTHTHTRIPTHSYSCTCSLTKPTSLNRHCTSPSVLVLGGLGCRLLCYWTELSGKCPTIGCCQLVKFFCYHGCRVSCPNVSQCIL